MLFVSAVGFLSELDGGTIVDASGHAEIDPASGELVEEAMSSATRNGGSSRGVWCHIDPLEGVRFR